MPKLDQYFTAELLPSALAAYARQATSRAWAIPHKIELYRDAMLAFDPRVKGFEGQPAFERVYAALRSYWQVFRSRTRGGHWSAPKTYHTLCTELQPYGRAASASLINIDPAAASDLLPRLRALAAIKPHSTYPTMAVSKFLHFYNPALFPIYDGAVISQKVLRRFRGSYRAFCKTHDLPVKATGADFLWNYMRWGGHLVRHAEPGLMPTFAAWLQTQAPAPERALGEAHASELYATAFEFVIIGAMSVEKAEQPRVTSAAP